MKKASLLCAVIVAACSTTGLLADIVTLSNGDKITGKITEITPAAVSVTTPYAGTLTIDRKQVKSLYSEAPVKVTAADASSHTTYVAPLADGSGWKESSAAAPVPVVVPPAVAVAPAPAPAEPKRFTHHLFLGPDWTNQLVIGAINQTGNTQSTELAGQLNLEYDKAPNELTIKIQGLYGTNQGKATDQLGEESVVYRRDISSRWYAFVDEDVKYDGLKGISVQGTLSAGPGYYFIKNDRMKLDLRAGPAFYYIKRFDNTETSNVAGQAALRFSYKLNERVNLTHDDSYTTSLQDSNQWTLNDESAATFKLDIERGLGLKLSFTDQYDNAPSGGSKNNDTRTMLALTLDF